MEHALPKRDNSTYSPRYCDKIHENIDREFKAVWDKQDKQDGKIDGIYTRMNVLLGSFALACILLVANLIIK